MLINKVGLKILPFLFLCSNVTARQDTLSLALTLGGQISDGNIKNTSINGALEVKGKKKRIDWNISPTYKYLNAYSYPITSASTPTRQNEFYMPSLFSYRVGDWKIMVFSEYEHSQIRKIQDRIDIGIGPSKKMLTTKAVSWDLSGVFLPDFYRSMSIKNAIPQRDNLSLRISVRSKLVIKTLNFTLTSIQIFQPAVYSWFYNSNEPAPEWSNNINLRCTNTIDVPIRKGFSFGIEADLIYQSYLDYLAKDPSIIKSGIYLTPKDTYFSFYLKYKNI